MVTQPTIEAANLGMADSLILMVLALVVFGPRRLPQIGRQIGKLMYEFRKASNDFKFQMEEELRNAEEADRRKAEEERLRALALAAPAQPATGAETDSQLPESEPGATATEAASMESPYPGESRYPDLAAQESQPEEAYPRILPPATGQQLQAERPASLAAQIEAQEPAAEEAAGEIVPAAVEDAEASGSGPERIQETVPKESPETGNDKEQSIPSSQALSPVEEAVLAKEPVSHDG